jgi:amidohydrolase
MQNVQGFVRAAAALTRLLVCICFGISPALGQATKTWVDDEVQRTTPEVVAAYKEIHEHPELGKQELRTAEFVRRHLKAAGYTNFISEPTLPTAVIAVLDTGRPGKIIVLRAELDARPGDEKVGVDYKSQEPGKMHSCGHDAHSAMLLTVANILLRHKEQLHGKFVFLFQPAEETPGGADDIVRDGILNSLKADMIFAQHVTPGLPVGAVQVAPGPVMASSTYFTVKVHGLGSHAASPEAGSDVVRVAGDLASAMSEFPARHFNVLEQATVVSVTHFEAGQHNALNKIPEDAEFEGTLRTFANAGTPEFKRIVGPIEEYVTKLAEANRVTAVIEWRTGSPISSNDPKLFHELVPELIRSWDGPFETENQRSMYSEDFAYYTSILPSLYFSLGISDGTRGTHGVHTDEFDISLESLPRGTKFLITLALVAQNHRASE